MGVCCDVRVYMHTCLPGKFEERSMTSFDIINFSIIDI